MNVKNISICLLLTILLSACGSIQRPTNVIRTVQETELADLDTDYITESITVSPDVRHIAYIEDVFSGFRIVVDDSPQECFDNIGRKIYFSSTSDFVAYFAYHEGYAGGIFRLFATKSYWEVIVHDNVHGSYENLLNNSLTISNDGNHVAYGALKYDIAHIYYDHEELPDYIYCKDPGIDSVYVYDVFAPFLFSPDSKTLAYVAETVDDEKWSYSVVVNGQAGRGHEYIYPHSLSFSPNSEKLAYVIVDSIYDKVIVNGEFLAGFDSIPDSMLQFSPNSEHLAYAAYDNEKCFLILDEIRGIPYDNIGTIVFSPDSKHLAYTAKDGDEWIVIKDKKEISRHSGTSILSLIFSPDSKHLIYATASDSGIVIYEDGEPIAFHNELVTPPVFSPDGKYLAYTIEENNTQSVVVNGIKRNTYPAIISHNGGRVVFDANNALHYLTIKDDNKVYLVEETLQ